MSRSALAWGVGAIVAAGGCGLSDPIRPADLDGSTPDVMSPIDGDLDAPIDVDATTPQGCVGTLAGGTGVGTVYYPVSGRVGLQAGTFTGTYESALFDGVSPTHVWSTIHWTPLRPSSKALPDNNMSETGYPSGNAIMTSNVFLAHFDEASGTSFDDSSINPAVGTCGTVSTCPTPVNIVPMFSRSAGFHGYDTMPGVPGGEGGDRIDFPDSAALEPSTDRVTIEAWAQVNSVPADFGTGMVVTKGHDSNPSPPAFTSYSIEFDDATRFFKCYMGFQGVSDTDRTLIGTMSMPLTLPTNWVHVACTYDGEMYRIYVNGEQRNFAARSEAILYDTLEHQGLYVGAWYTWQYLDGRVDEVAIYDEALGDTAIRDHYLRGANKLYFQVRSCPDPTACLAASFVGPDGTTDSFYTEQCRPPGGGAPPLGPPTLDLNDVDCNFDGLPDHTPSDPVVPPNRYIQVRASFSAPPFGPHADELQLVDVNLCE